MSRPAPAGPVLAVALVLAGLCLGGCGSNAARRSAATSTTTSSSSSSSSATTTGGPRGPVGSAHLAVTPATGHRTSVVRFAFTAQSRSGRIGQGSISYTLIVSGGHGSGCVGAHSSAIGVDRAGQAVSAPLGPAQLGGPWCPGSYEARVEELARPVCGPGQMCPQYIRVVAVYGPARFRILG